MKITRRRVWITAILFAVVAALSLAFLLGFGGDRITQANVDRIQTGMSLEQVKEVLGPPTDSTFEIYMDGKLRDVIVTNTYYIVAKPYYWEGTHGTATVYIRDNIAIYKTYVPKQNTWWSRVKRFFGL